MKIRSITCFFDPRAHGAHQAIDRMGQLRQAAYDQFTKTGREVQSTRLASVPFAQLYQASETERAVEMARQLEVDGKARGFEYISVGPAQTSNPESYEMVLPIISATKDVFVSGMLTTPNGEVSLAAIQSCAEIVSRTATVTPDGFTNLRFGALANVGPWVPFLPGAYHQGERPAFALAMECADIAYDAARKSRTLAEARQTIVNTLEAEAVALTSTANYLAQRFDMDFKGIDFSYAPFPEAWCSLGAALEALGLPALGSFGSLAAAAFLADTLDRGSWLRTGYNGMMMPVLEDATLAARAAEGTFTVQDLLMYSAVCGTGLDTVPIPGDTTPAQIAAVMLDVAALALRLNKPLTARLMPIPGKKAGDVVNYDFSYATRSAVMPLRAAPLGNLLTGNEAISIRPRARM